MSTVATRILDKKKPFRVQRQCILDALILCVEQSQQIGQIADGTTVVIYEQLGVYVESW